MRIVALVLAVGALLGPAATGAGAPRACDAAAYRALPTLRPSYRMELRIAGSRVTGTGDIRFAANKPLRRLVIRLWPNGPGQGAVLAVSRVTAGGIHLALGRLRRCHPRAARPARAGDRP